MKENGFSVECVANWLLEGPIPGSWIPDPTKGTEYILWFHDGVINKAHPGAS